MAIREITYAYNKHGNPVLGRPYPEETSMSYLKGAVLVQDATSKELEEGGADPTNIGGIAIAAASGTAGTDVPHYVPGGGNVFEGTIDDGTENGSYALLATDIGSSFGLAKTSGGFWYVDKSETSTKSVRVIGAKDEVGAFNARVFFEFLSSVDILENDS